MTGDISYDLVMEEDMGFVEGCYRIGGGSWQVLIVNKQPVEKTEFVLSSWESGATGLEIHVSVSTKLNRSIVEELLAECLGINKWDEVRGPDSMQLR